MPVTPTYPGVYIEEIPSGIRTIVGVATSITAFIGQTLKGRDNEPVRIQSYADFDRAFGGLWVKSALTYAVQQYFQNGGQDAIIVRVHKGAAAATVSVSGLELKASSPGVWGNHLRVSVNLATRDPNDGNLFNLVIEELENPAASADPGDVVATETLRNLSIASESPRFYQTVIREEAELIDLANNTVITTRPEAVSGNADGGTDGDNITVDEVTNDNLADNRQGLYALDKADLFNLLCIPPLIRGEDVPVDTVYAKAAEYCKKRRALLIVDPPSTWTTIADAVAGINNIRDQIGTKLATNVAVYFPRLKMADALKENLTEEFVPSGVIAGICARTDTDRGVWKAPAGIDASLSGVRELTYKMTDPQNGQLNPLGLNCIRSFPVYGTILWGARTLAGADQLASEWKYVPVRRFALFLQESLYRGTQWVVFEPNDEPLWAQIRLNIGVFMQDLFRQGAFQGKTPAEAYFVKCDKETTTQSDINRGIVNIVVGFAPLKPAEFVILKFQQIAGQLAT
ncbi:MAG: phage tail sheath subtilisin-like domain-containing protein [Phormidium tanganyikae FI6-MK23]|jgi:hypothetical protein|nr:phage tail sheath subtilisin-like domain-containing protein [Phormidium tanganyikae FI6-MK23]